MTSGIAIIGAGPCGLALARLLESKGIDYIVYERDDSETSNRAGGTLDIHEGTGQLVLRECGLYDEFRKLARDEDTSLAITDKFGKRIFEMEADGNAPEIDRFQLRQILLDSIPKDKIKWGHTLANTKLDGNNKPVLQFTNGVVLSRCKLIVGADGAWSKVRPLITQAKPQYAGTSYIESRIQPDNPLYEATARIVGAGNFLSVGSGKLIAIQRLGDRSYRIYFGVKISEDAFRNGTIDLQDTEAMRSLLLSQDFYADWSSEFQDIIRHATDFRGWPHYYLPAESMIWKSVSGVTLLGDAAHVAVPNGEGVNCAMFDSLQLVSKIIQHGSENVDRAVQEYEADMFTRGIDSINQGLQMADVMYSEGPEPFVQLLRSWLDRA